MQENKQITTALVSTNSIAQGEQVATLWSGLLKDGLQIHFAHRTFRWDSEANAKAHVHCVIIGFGYTKPYKKVIFEGEREFLAKNINAYLVDAENEFIEARKKPLCNVPEVVFGNMPNDGGYLSNFTTEEKDSILNKYPQSESMFRKLLGATEFLNNKERWCLWLQGIPPTAYKSIPPIYEAVNNVYKLRNSSNRAATKKLAEYPMLFGEIRQPSTEYMIIPCHSSENRRYVPLGFVPTETIANNAVLILPDTTLYHFGILTSNVHMAWMRVVCGRIKSDYRYSANVVYNNFPWPTPTDQQKAKIEQTAQAILDARSLYPNSSLADLYDEVTMPPELRKAHQANDKAVMQAYGFPIKDFTESDCVAELFKLYNNLTKPKND